MLEDEVIVAFLIEDMLTGMGYEVVGPVFDLQSAIDVARDGDFGFAVLDVNIGGKRSFPVADILCERDIPFIFATGYGAQGLIDPHRSVTTLKKPFTAEQLQRALQEAE